MSQAFYNSINAVLRKKFGCKVFKVSLESGCGCPNRDGKISFSGCTFCSEEAYLTAVSSNNDCKSLRQTLLEGIEYVKKRHRAAKFISYFQSGANTHGDTEKLRPIFEAAIEHPEIVGLAVATRPDCITTAHVNLLKEFSSRTMLWVELGLQSANDETLRRINRGHTVEDFKNAAELLNKNGISVVAHVILGLPGESTSDMAATANFLNEANVSGVKIHNLHVLKGTELETLYNDGKIELPELKTYASWVADFLEHLNPNVLIHRVNGHAPRHLTVAPQWSINKLAIFNAVERELERRNSRQGTRYCLARISKVTPSESR